MKIINDRTRRWYAKKEGIYVKKLNHNQLYVKTDIKYHNRPLYKNIGKRNSKQVQYVQRNITGLKRVPVKLKHKGNLFLQRKPKYDDKRKPKNKVPVSVTPIREPKNKYGLK